MQQVTQPVSRLIQLAYLAIASLLLVCSFKYPPLADYIEWMYQSFILSDLIQGNAESSFYLRDYPVPYFLVQIIMGGLNPLMGPIWAGKATLVIYLVLGAWLSRTFIDRYELNGVLAYPLLLSCIILNSSFWSGYINYQYGLLVLMAYLSFNDKWQDKTWINLIFAILAFASHGFCLLAFGVIAGVRACTRGWPAIFLFALACLPAFFLALWYMLVHNNDAMQAMDAPAAYLSMKFWAYKIYTLTKAGPYQNFMLGAVSDIDRAPILYYVGVATNVLIGALLVALHVEVLRRFSNPKTLHLSIAASIFALAYLLAPSVAMQIVNPGERILYPELLCVFAVALSFGPSCRASRGAKYLAGYMYALLTATMVSLVVATHQQGYQHRSLDAFKEVQKNYTRILYWHRPYQFEDRFEHMEHAYRSHSQSSLPIIFPTSVIGNKR